MSEVKVWYMTEEERLAYIKKHPIVPTKRKKGDSFADIYSSGYESANRKRKAKR
ncbi:hypothetical protein [Priestia aryabhattai]|uniref:hypothetical protein n=1 Tax=Priestia aryabhattai TaxID=412384 RepID=UPI0015C59ED7|nr:hypothetical protein [Priestia aryabhattai]